MIQEYNHYYRLDGNGIVIYAFSDASEQPVEGDFLVGTGERQFSPTIQNMQHQYMYKVVNGQIMERSQEELEAELSAQPEPQPTVEERLQAAEELLLTMMLGG